MVSEMIGEMLKLSMVVTLVAVLSISVYAYLPDERIPYAEIVCKFPENSTDNSTDIVLIHAGGDPLLISDVSIVVVKDNIPLNRVLKKTWIFSEKAEVIGEMPKMDNVSEIMVVHRRAVLFKYETGWKNESTGP